MTTLIGRTINGRYRLEALLGDGGMGSVYRAHDLNLDRQVAIKMMHAHFARREEFRARLVQEAKTAAQLDHPSVVKIFDFGESEDGLFIAMEYVDGGSLREHLRRLQRLQKYLPLDQSLQIVIQISDALGYAHQRGIIHRDVKPGNIILKRLSEPDKENEQPFRAVLTDFGLVKLQEGTGMTELGTTVGTPTYMSPEQCRHGELTGRTDIYSLGVVLYELVTNKLPFAMQTLSEAIAIHDKGIEAESPRQIRSDIPAMIEAIISKALAKDPSERFATAGELSSALRNAVVALKGAPTQVMSAWESDILERVEEPPKGFELTIETPGHDPSVLSLTKPVISLGRNADNDIVLPTDGVSRHHARLQATLNGWELVDLGGINGTWLDDVRLRADAPMTANPGSEIRIGPYRLFIIGPAAAPGQPQTDSSPRVLAGTTPRMEPVAEMPTEASTASPRAVEPLGLYLPVENIAVEPGQSIDLNVEVVNRGQSDDRVSIRVQGLPSSWISSPGKFETVPVGKTAQLVIRIRPPRNRGTPAGRQRFRVALVSQRHPDLQLAAAATLMIGAFVSFEASMDREQIRLPGILTVSIQNSGNTAADFSIIAKDRQSVINFRGERGRIRLEPGQVAKVELEMSARRQGLFGGGQLYPFEVEVVSSGGGRQVLSSEAQSGSAIPVGVLYGLIFLVTFACVIGAMALIFSRDRLTGTGETPVPAVNQLSATETAAAAMTMGAATEIAATAAVQGDIDEDGLSNEQEALLGTDPNKADTDQDGLSDGEEMLTIGSDPRKRDSDGDILSDGDEVKLYGTDPTNIDTDGDGVNDGTEVTQGSDPLTKPPETATPTNTAEPTGQVTAEVTETSTSTATPTSTASATATLQPPSTATATPTNTSTPTPTSTAAPTAAATATDTAVPTPTASATASATSTPMPSPLLACASTPPAIDGAFLVTEWTAEPLFEFQPDANINRLTQVYFVRDLEWLYLAFLINDDIADASDSLRLYFDTTSNGGDPDTSDRFFQIGRDGTTDVWAGVGSNSDRRNWNSDYDSDNWSALIGEPGGDQWVVELKLDAAAELVGLANPFRLMAQVLYTGDLAAWPESATSNNPGSWQPVENIVCP